MTDREFFLNVAKRLLAIRSSDQTRGQWYVDRQCARAAERVSKCVLAGNLDLGLKAFDGDSGRPVDPWEVVGDHEYFWSGLWLVIAESIDGRSRVGCGVAVQINGHVNQILRDPRDWEERARDFAEVCELLASRCSSLTAAVGGPTDPDILLLEEYEAENITYANLAKRKGKDRSSISKGVKRGRKKRESAP